MKHNTRRSSSEDDETVIAINSLSLSLSLSLDDLLSVKGKDREEGEEAWKSECGRKEAFGKGWRRQRMKGVNREPRERRKKGKKMEQEMGEGRMGTNGK